MVKDGGLLLCETWLETGRKQSLSRSIFSSKHCKHLLVEMGGLVIGLVGVSLEFCMGLSGVELRKTTCPWEEWGASRWMGVCHPLCLWGIMVRWWWSEQRTGSAKGQCFCLGRLFQLNTHTHGHNTLYIYIDSCTDVKYVCTQLVQMDCTTVYTTALYNCTLPGASLDSVLSTNQSQKSFYFSSLLWLVHLVSSWWGGAPT